MPEPLGHRLDNMVTTKMTMANNTSQYTSGSNNGDDPQGYVDVSPALFQFATILTTYVQPILCIFGLIGSLFSLIIFMSKSMRKISSNVYLAALSGSSYGFNLVLFMQWLEMVNVPLMHMPFFCEVLVYFSYVFSFLSVWFIVCITVENYIVTFHLSKAAVYCSVVRAKVVTLSLITLSIFMYAGQFWTAGVVDFDNGVRICTEIETYNSLNRIYNYVDTILTLFIPMLLTTCLIIAILAKNIIVDRKSANIVNRRLSKKQKTLLRITRVLLAISLTFVILGAPSHINKIKHLLDAVISGQKPVSMNDRIVNQLLQILYYSSFCLNFVYYLSWSFNFRKECRRFFCMKDKRRNNPNVKLIQNGNHGGGIVSNHTERITLL